MQIELWGQVFKDFKQVKKVSVDSSAERLDIIIEGHNEILHATSKELDKLLIEFSGNPHEVVTSFLKEHRIIVYYQNTLVGFFDIQAYSAFIEYTGMIEAVKKITHLLQTIIHTATTDVLAVKFDRWILSDSIIVVVDTNRHPLFAGSLTWFLETCSVIMGISMMNGFPLRGAIGGGDFYKNGEIIVSSGLVDAAKHEKEQDWLGAVLTRDAHIVIEKAREYEIMHKGKTDIHSSLDAFNSCVRHGVIPWKTASEFAKKEDNREMYYIKPYMANINDEVKKNWASVFLPPYYNKNNFKINNSHHLYAE